MSSPKESGSQDTHTSRPVSNVANSLTAANIKYRYLIQVAKIHRHSKASSKSHVHSCRFLGFALLASSGSGQWMSSPGYLSWKGAFYVMKYLWVISRKFDLWHFLRSRVPFIDSRFVSHKHSKSDTLLKHPTDQDSPSVKHHEWGWLLAFLAEYAPHHLTSLFFGH